MAAVHPLPAPAAEQARETPDFEDERALVSAETGLEPGQASAPRALIGRLPVELDVAIPVREFRVRNLLALEPGEVIETQWTLGEDMPLTAGAVQLAWSEFEVIDTQLAVRVTRLT